jgi:Ca2+-binding EF-hand superfamily protein
LERAATSTNTAVSERQLRELFEEADVRHRGYLMSDELWPLFATATGTSRTDTDGAARVFRSMLARYGDRGRITFEAFAVIMLHAASL